MNETNNKTGVSTFASASELLRRWNDGTFGEIVADWKWIFQFSARYKGPIAFYVILGILSTTMGLVSSVVGKYLIDIITGYQTDRLVFLALIMVGSGIGSLLFDSVIRRISAKLQIDIHNDIQADIFAQIMDADWLSVSKYASGDMLSRFNEDVNTISKDAISWLPSIIIAIYRFAATFCVICYYDWVMAVIALISAPVLLVSGKFLVKKQRDYQKQVRQMGSKMMSFEVETFYNLDSIKSFGVEGEYRGRLRSWQEKFKEISLLYNLFSIKTNVLLSLLGMIVGFVAFGYCLFRLWTHSITYGTMTLFLQQRSSLSNAFSSCVAIIPTFLSGSVSAHRLRELTELPREIHLPESSQLDQVADQGVSVEIHDVDFSYVEENQVITQSTMEAHPGDIVALIGPSGEGKTTMIRLMLGLIRPESGSVTIRGADGVAVPANADVRRFFSYVPQGNTMVSGTIAENMRVVQPEATEEDIVSALKMACAWEFVEKLPDGIHASVGERGRGFSEGQAQRLTIARAILRDAPVLLMDEATSALDEETEQRVLENIMAAQPNKTIIVTTHRLSVLKLCRRIYRVIDTKVTELENPSGEEDSYD